MVCGQRRLTLVAACGSLGAPRAGTARVPIIGIIVIGHGRGS
jgi:hypothetical protein